MPGAMNVRQKLAKGRPLVGHSNVGPTVTIDTPYATNPVVNVPTRYSAVATDAEQGDISDQIVWRIRIGKGTYQILGRGRNPLITFDATGTETLYALITDGFGDSDSDSAFVTVVAPAGSP